MASTTTDSHAEGRPADSEVENLLEKLEHPFDSEIRALRAIILAADPSISEGIKWNAPSFRTTEYFATMHLRAKEEVQVILHRGAKKRDDAAGPIHDPQSLLQWLGADRASVVFRNAAEIEANARAFAALVREWIRYV